MDLRSIALSIGLAVASTAACAAGAVTFTNWDGVDTDVWDASSWSGGGTPVDGDRVIVVNNGNDGGVSQRLDVAPGYASPSYRGLIVDGSSSGSMNLVVSGVLSVMDATGGSFSVGAAPTVPAATTVVGYSASVGGSMGVLTLQDGGVLFTGTMIVGADVGSAGTVNVQAPSGGLNVTANATLIVGDAGTGVLNQSAGTTNDVNLFVGNQSTGNGTVNVTGGNFNIAYNGDPGPTGVATIGNFGVGVMNQSNADGPSTVVIGAGGQQYFNPTDPYGGYLFIGKNDGGDGRYTITDTGSGNPVSLTVGREIQIGGSNIGGFSCLPGQSCVGAFEQNGGTVGALGVSIGIGNGTGSYTMNGGTLYAFLDIGNSSGGNTFTQNGGTVHAGGMFLSNASSLFGNPTPNRYELNAGTLNTDSFALVGISGVAQFELVDGTHNVRFGTLSIGTGYSDTNYGDATYRITGAGTVNALRIDVAPIGIGLLVQDSGTINAVDVVIGGDGTNAGHGGTVRLNGGTMNIGFPSGDVNGSGGLIVGNSGVGTFVMTGGTLVVGDGNPLVQQVGIGMGAGATGLFEHSGGDVVIHGNMLLGRDAGSLGTYNLKTGSNPTLTVDNLTVSFDGTGVFNQYAFTKNTVTSGLFIGTSDGTYNLFGGTLDVGGQGTIVGNFAQGVFNQSGGVHTTQNLSLAQAAGGTGTYNLTGGQLIVLDNTTVGSSGTGVFDNSAGSHETNFLTLGACGGCPNASGTYNLSATGVLQVANTATIGVFGYGEFNQSGGTATFGALVIGEGPEQPAGPGNLPFRQGVYNLSGGTMTVTGNETIGAGNGFFVGEPGGKGTFSQTAGSHTVGGDLILGGAGSEGRGSGSYTLDSNGDANVGVLNVGNALIVGQGGTGTFHQNGGTVNVSVNATGAFLTIGDAPGAVGTYTLDAGKLVVDGTILIGGGGTGTMTVNGGLVTTNFLDVGFFGSTGNGTLNVTGGVITVNNNLVVGNELGNVGTVNQTGGTVHVNDPFFGIGIDHGTYKLSGAGSSLVVVSSVFVGNAGGPGLFEQSGGTHSIGGFLKLGVVDGVQGTYTMSGGSLTVGGEIHVGVHGKGVFDHSGGTVNAASLVLGYNKATPDPGVGDGTYLLSGTGALSTTGTQRVGLDGKGAFVQSGGSNIVGGGLVIGQNAGAVGTYTLSGGTAAVTGAVTIASNPGATGTLNVSGGSLTAASMAVNAGGTLNHSGGSISLGGGSGTLANAVGGQVNFSGPGQRVLDGRLQNSGAVSLSTNAQVNVLAQTGGTIALGTSTLSVAKDYTNANWGVGNAFDARAGVSGTGQVAGVNASQTITGAVTNAGANTFTLNLGNVRGGASTTVNYQIANNGTGADIRGAIQTGAPGLGGVTDGRLSGAGVTAANFGPIAAGASSGNLSVTFSATSGGSLVGQSVAVVSNFGNVATQTINLAGQASALATGSATPNANPVDLGNFRVGGAQPSQQFAVQNTTSGPGAERLGIQNVSTGGQFSATNNLGAGFVAGGATQSNAVGVSVAGGQAGVNTGSVTIQYTTNGQLIDPSFTSIGANSQTVNLKATGYLTATGAVNTPVLNFGTVQVGQQVQQMLSITNDRVGPAGFVEDLNARFGAATGTGAALIGGTGQIVGLAAGATNASSMLVSVNTSAAGTVNGAIDVNFFSSGKVAGVDKGLGGEIAANSVAYGVSGLIQAQVVNTASPTINTSQPIHLGNVRVGDVSPTANVSVTNQTTSAPQAALNATIAGNAPITASGAFNLLSPGQTNASALQVGMSTANAGAISGTATISFVSDASNIGNCAPNCQLNLASQNVQVSGNVFQVAAGSAVSSVQVANQRIGGTNTAVVGVTHSGVGPNGFVEDLNVTVGGSGGQASASGSIVGRLAGTSNTGTGAILAGVSTLTEGGKSGSVTLNYETAGKVAGVGNGLGTLGVGSSAPIAVTGNVFKMADGQVQTAPMVVNLQVGQSVSQDLVIRNVATGLAGFVEDLNARFGASTDARIVGAGTLGGILAGQNSTASNGTMTVTVNGTSAGAINGSIAVLYQTAGAVGGTSNGLGLAERGSENYAVTGQVQANVIDTAKPVINGVAHPGTVSVNFGNVRQGEVANQTLTVLNQSTGAAQQGALNASIASNGLPVTASGAFTGLAAGASNPPSGTGTPLQVGLNTSQAGALAGTATVSLVSDISQYGNCSPNCTLNLASQTVSVSGNVYRLANPTLDTPSVTIAARVGDAASATRSVQITNTSPDAYTEGLKVTLGTISGNAQANGATIANLTAQAIDTGTIKVGLASTASAGTTTGTVALNLVSTGAGTTGATDFALGTQAVTVNGKVYAPAVAQLNTTVVDFGVVRINQAVVDRHVTVTNGAAPTTLNDTLAASIASGGSPFTATGSAGGLGAGQSNAPGTLRVGLSTSAAGVFSAGNAQVSFKSQNPDMADADLGSQNVTLKATVNYFARPLFTLLSGFGLTGAGSSFTLDLGNLVAGGGPLHLQLGLANADQGGPQDGLRGSFDTTGVNDFSASGWGSVPDLSAGQMLAGLMLDFDPTALGAYTDTIVFHGLSFNASDPSGVALGDVTLLLRANVIDGTATVPEPGVLGLAAIAALAAFAAARARRRARALH